MGKEYKKRERSKSVLLKNIQPTKTLPKTYSSTTPIWLKISCFGVQCLTYRNPHCCYESSTTILTMWEEKKGERTVNKGHFVEPTHTTEGRRVCEERVTRDEHLLSEFTKCCLSRHSKPIN